MKKFGIFALTIGMLAVNNLYAAEIVSEANDATTGKATGGMTGMMIGGVGGPLGALVGAGVGALFGGATQGATGTFDRAYVVRTDSGDLKTYRSPNYIFSPGDKVVIYGNRPRPYGWTPETAKSYPYNG